MIEVQKIDRLIINKPHVEPKQHWKYSSDTKSFSIQPGRRDAGYIIASERARSYDDPGTFVSLPLVNKIRPRIREWRESGYPGATSISKRLLEHWTNRSGGSMQPFFFCQLEAIETLMWIVEAPSSSKVGIDIPNDGGEFIRYCAKMATGTGKTVVMSMVVAWQVLNKASNPKDTRFSLNILVMAPGLTVKSRLQVLNPNAENNYYEEFSIVPSTLMNLMRQGKVRVLNWHTLQWDDEERVAKRKSVDKRGALSDEAYVRDVLGDLSKAKNLVVINDEAHHAWRIPAELKEKKIADVTKDEVEQATKWIGGLDRIHKARGILSCFDFSATPFAPTGKKTTEEALFGWIVSDFGLNDAIESGLVKTPRVVVRDDGIKNAATYKSKLYHIYDEISDNINRPAKPHETLPDLLIAAYNILSIDWLETFKAWSSAKVQVPPVMISVVNRTETAARIKHAFDSNTIMTKELCDPSKTLHIDSKVLKESEDDDLDQDQRVPDEESSEKDQDSYLRRQVNTVGQVGKPGEQIRHIISVNMLSEGWDAKTVTHILGLRAFSSQLLCEQVVGRGLRRTSYELNKEGLLEPEYVNVFGVPFSFLPHEGGDVGGGLRPTPPKTRIEPLRDKIQYEMHWPNVLRIDHKLDHSLELNLNDLPELEIKSTDMPTEAELAPVIEGKPDLGQISEIDLKKLITAPRMQTLIFKFATHLLPQIEEEQKWKGGKHQLFADLVSIVERVLNSDKIRVSPKVKNDDPEQRNLYLRLNMDRIVRHVGKGIINQNAQGYEILYNTNEPVRYTRDAGIWFTSKPHYPGKKSHINFCVYDSTWEEQASRLLDKLEYVEAWVKNDHIGFEISYLFNGAVKNYLPDFLIRFKGGKHLILEIKGVETEQDREKWAYLSEWCKAVTASKRYGTWVYDVALDPNKVEDILSKHGKSI